MKGVYWLILLQYSIININSQLVKHDKLEPTTTISPTEEPETNSQLPKQFHPNFMSSQGAFDYGPFGTHPMSHPSGQSNTMFQIPQMFNPADPAMFPMVPPPVAAEMMSQQLPPSQQMYPGQPPSSQMYPGQRPSSQMYLRQPPSPQMYPGQPPSPQMYPGQPPSPQMYPGQPSSPQMYPGQPSSPQMYPGQPPNPQMYLGQPSSPQMYPGQPSNMMQMMSPTDPRAFGPAADHPAILPVLTPDHHPLAPGMLLPNPSFLPLKFPMSINPPSLIHPEAEPTEWVPLPTSTWGGENPPNTFLENFFPEMHPFSNPSLIQYPSHITPTPQHYYHPKGMSFIPQLNPQLPEGKGTSSKPSQSSAVAAKESRSQSEPLTSKETGSHQPAKESQSKFEPSIGPLIFKATTGSHQTLQPPGHPSEGSALATSISHPQHPMDIFAGSFSGPQFPPNSAYFLPQPFSQQPFQVQGYELGATGFQPRSQAEILPGPFSEQPFPAQRGSILPQPFSNQPYQSKGAPQGEPNPGFSPFNFMPSFLHDPFLLPIPSTGERPGVQPGGHVPMDPAAEPGDFPSLMDYMHNENPFDMPPPPPFLNSHAPIFPVLPPFLEGLPAPSENGQSIPGKKWRYKNRGHLKWPSKYSYCSGNRQSPVDIDDRNIIYTPNLKQFTFTGFDGYNTAFTVKNNGHTASVRVSGNMSVGGGGFGDVYNTAEIHFHWGSNDRDGSEHAINGRKYPLEMHIVNYATKYGDLKNAMQYRDGLGVLGVLFDIGPENLAFGEIERQLKKVQNPGTSAPLPRIDVSELLPVNAGDYFRYYGSLTTPPCYQSVLWTIFEQRQTISPSQLESLRSLYETTKNIPVAPNTVIFGEALSDNFRPLQPMFGRIINTNIKRYADPIYLAHPGMVNIPAVFRQSRPQFHPNKIPAKSTAAATTTSKKVVNQVSTSALPSQKAALNNVEPRVANISTVSSFRGTNGSVITVVDVPGNVSKPAELIVVNTSGIVEQLNQPAAQPTPGIPTTRPVAFITTTNPQTTNGLKQLHPVITSTTPAITTATSVLPTLLPITTSTKTPTSTTSQTTTILTTPTLLQPTSPTLPPTTSTVFPATFTSSSSSTAQPIYSQLKEIVQNFPSQSQDEALYPSLGPIISSTLVPSTSSQLPGVLTQEPLFEVVNPVDLSTQIVSDPLFQTTTPLSSNPAQLSQRVVQEARKAAIEAAKQQLAMGSKQSPEFTQSVIAAATKAARAQIALLMAAQSTGKATTQQVSTAPLTLPMTSTVEPLKAQSVKSRVSHFDPSQPQTADQLAQHAVNQAFQDNIVQQLLVEQQAPQKAAQQHLKQQTAQQTAQQVVDQQQLHDQQAVNQAVQHNLAQQLLLEQQAPQKAAQQHLKQQTAQQTAQQVVDQQQLRDQHAVNQAVQHNLVQKLLLEQQAPQKAVEQIQLAGQRAAQQTVQQIVDQQQLRDQQAVNQAFQQNLVQQAASQTQSSVQAVNTASQQTSQQQQLAQHLANHAAQQQTNQHASNQQQPSQQLTNQALRQLLAQQLANQQAVDQAAQQQLANQQAVDQAAQQQLANQQAADQAAQQQLANQQAAHQAAQQQTAQQAANQAAQQQLANQQAANQAAQQQLANQQAANQAAQQQIAQQAADQAAQQQLANQQAANQAAQQQLANQQAANQAAQQQLANQQAANQAAQQQIAQQAAQQQIAQQTANQATQPQATQAQLIQQVLAQMRKQVNFDKLTQQQIIKLVSNRVIQHQNLQQTASRTSQVPTNPFVPQQLRQQPQSLQTPRLPASTSALAHSGNTQHQRSVKLSSPVSGITTNRQGTSSKTRNTLIQPSAQGTPVVSVLRKAPQPVQTFQSNRAQNVQWASLQRARANAQAKAKATSQALTAPKSVSVLVPRQKNIVATVRFASTSQKLHPVNVLPNQVRFKDSNTVKQETGLMKSNMPSVLSYPQPPASPTGSQSSLIAAYFRALSVSKPAVVPVLRRVRTQYGDKKLLNYLQKKFGRLRTV